MTDQYKPDRQDGNGLLPCPFCGDEADYYPSNEAVFSVSWIGHIVNCKICQARVQTAVGEKTAREMWNNRATQSPTRDAAEGAERNPDRDDLPSANELLPSFAAPPQPAPDAVRAAAIRFISMVELTSDHALWFESIANLMTAVRSPAPVPSPDGAGAQDFWHELVEKTDRTSPEEYPEMALITFEELRDFVRRALSPATGAAEPVALNIVVTGEMQDAFDNALPKREDACHPNDRDKPLYNALADGDVFTKAFLAALALALPPVRGDLEAIARIRYANGKYDLREVLRAGFREMRFVHPDIAADDMIDAILSLRVQPSSPPRVPV